MQEGAVKVLAMTAAGNGLHDKSIQQWAVYVVKKLYFDEALSYVGLVVLNSHKFSSLCLHHALWVRDGPHWCGSSQPPQLAIPYQIAFRLVLCLA